MKIQKGCHVLWDTGDTGKGWFFSILKWLGNVSYIIRFGLSHINLRMYYEKRGVDE